MIARTRARSLLRIACSFDIDLFFFTVLYMFGKVDFAITISDPDIWTRGGAGNSRDWQRGTVLRLYGTFHSFFFPV